MQYLRATDGIFKNKTAREPPRRGVHIVNALMKRSIDKNNGGKHLVRRQCLTICTFGLSQYLPAFLYSGRERDVQNVVYCGG